MKKTVVGLASVMLSAVSFGATKPIAQWSFDDASNIGAGSYGTAALSDHSADGKGPTSVEGRVGKAYHASCGSMMLGLSTDVPTGSSPFTWSGWLRPDSTSTKTAYLVICSPITGGKPGDWKDAGWGGWHLRFESETQLYVGFNSWGKAQGGTSDREFGCTVANTIYNDGNWHHFVVSRDAKNLVKIYLDGALKASKTVSTSVAANSRIRLGTHATSGNYFVGDYDEEKVYDVALTDQEVLREYQAGVTELSVPDLTTVESWGRRYGDVTGAGTLKFTGLGYAEFFRPGALGFTGTYQLYAANADFGTPWDPNAADAAATLDVAGGGSMNFFADQTVAKVGGEGLCGAVSIADGKTLTVADEGEASLAGGLNGAGTVAKTGSGTLTLKGKTSVANVSVDAGTLVAEKGMPFYAKGLVSYWRFEDGTALGRNLGRGGDLAEFTAGGATTTQLSDGARGKGVSLRKGTTIANALLAPVGAVPTGSGSFTVAAWIRPASNSPKTAYILVNRTVTGGKPGSWTGASWNGWNMRFISEGYYLSVDYQNSWREHKDDNQSLRGRIPGTVAYNDGKWHHVALTRQVTEDTSGATTKYQYVSTLYFDGEAIATKELTVNQGIASDARFAIGGQDTNNSFSGDYDEVMAFSQCLSADEIATIYRTRKPIPETRLMDEATAHWSFDESVTEGGNRLFKDTGAGNLQCDFLNVTNSSGEFVECVTGEGINGGAAYVRAKGSCLKLLDSSRAGSKLVQYGWPTFSISIRLKNVSYTGKDRFVPLCFGNGKTKEACLRLSYERTADADPQYLKVLAGEDGTAHALDDTSAVADANAPWTTITLVNNQVAAGNSALKVYRDGVFVKEISTIGTKKEATKTVFDFDLSFVGIGSNNLSTYSGFMVDDFCVFRKRVLSETEIKRLVLEQAGLTGAPLADAAVSVAKDATLKVGVGEYALSSLSGAGEVNLDPYATLAVEDWTGFTGALSGTGAVRVSKPMPDRTFALAVIDPTGVVTFDAEPEPGNYVIAKAGAFELPDDFSGWKVLVGGVEMPSGKYRFKIVGDAFVCKIKGGTAIIIR